MIFELLSELNQMVNFIFAMNFERVDEVGFKRFRLMETRGLA